MFYANNILTIAAFVKWINGEPLAKEDVERIIAIFETRPLALSSLTQQGAAAIQVRLRQVLHTKFGGPKNE